LEGRGSASALSRLNGVERLQDELDDAIGLQRAECDQLTESSKNDPEGRMVDDFHG